MEDKLLKLLYDDHVITDEQYQQVLEECKNSSVSPDAALENLNILDEEGLVRFLSEKFRMPIVNWDAYQPDPELLDIIPDHIASKYTIFPYAIERGKRQNKITLAIANPSNMSAIEGDISFMTGVYCQNGNCFYTSDSPCHSHILSQNRNACRSVSEPDAARKIFGGATSGALRNCRI